MPYDPTFVAGFDIPLPMLGPRVAPVAFNAGAPIDHPRFSIIFNQERGFAIATAHNIDGASMIPQGVIRRGNYFDFDDEVPEQIQVGNDQGYRGYPEEHDNPWDRGHLVRRRSLHWGSEPDARDADKASYVYTNIAPQHKELHKTGWRHIEEFMLEAAESADKRACVFQGPVLTPDDPEIVNMPGQDPIKIPAGFWKVFCIKHGNNLRAASFLVWQRDFDDLGMSFNPFLEQVRITTIEYLTGLTFVDLVRTADPLLYSDEPAPIVPAPISGAPAAAPVVARPRGAIASARDIKL